MAHVSIGSTLGYLNEQKQTRNPFKNKKKSQNFKNLENLKIRSREIMIEGLPYR